jgi:hypothetical protein
VLVHRTAVRSIREPIILSQNEAPAPSASRDHPAFRLGIQGNGLAGWFPDSLNRTFNFETAAFVRIGTICLLGRIGRWTIPRLFVNRGWIV